MPIVQNIYNEDPNYRCGRLESVSDDGTYRSGLSFNTVDSRFCGNDLKALTIGGIGTRPEYRRCGYVREMLTSVLQTAPEYGWAVSFLHPFSFSYYRKFGYEKVCDHKIIEFPLSKLDFVPRCNSFVPVNSRERATDCVSIYNQFASGRNIMFRRYGTSNFPKDGSAPDKQYCYIWYDGDNNPGAFIRMDSDQYYHVNRMVSVALNVREFGYTSPEGLRAILGFLRMFEGEDNTVIVHNIAMAPEFDAVLRHYMHTTYKLEPDIMARVLNVPTMLSAFPFPERHGHFNFNLIDDLPFTNGQWEVEFENGQCQVTRMAEGSRCDLTLPMPAFSQLIYGYDEYDETVCRYMEGVTVEKAGSDFFVMTHKKRNGLFEHF